MKLPLLNCFNSITQKISSLVIVSVIQSSIIPLISNLIKSCPLSSLTSEKANHAQVSNSKCEKDFNKIFEQVKSWNIKSWFQMTIKKEIHV